ncbi:MAG: Calx-beta domain-containing protein [Chthoniobacteraceae bacterium]
MKSISPSIERLETRIAPAFAAVLDLSSLSGLDGFRLDGDAGDLSGSSVSGAGDVNGDGFGDLIIGAEHANSNGPDSGTSYVVFGRANGFSATLDLSTLDGVTGFKIEGGAAVDLSGRVSGAGDVNGDGFDDLIVGARGADPNGAESGSSSVIFGKANGFSPSVNLSALDGIVGFNLRGESAGDQSGQSVSAAGDVNGDGLDDLIIGAYLATSNGIESGASYVVFGRTSGFGATFDLSALDGSNGFKVLGEAAGDRSGVSVHGAGDVNGDGFDDIIVGARGADANGTNSGASYVVFGRAGAFSATFDLSTLDGITGFKLLGEVAGDFAGESVSGAGDVNGDGFDDLLVGARGADPNGANSGAGYVIFGQASGFTASVILSTLDGATGFKLLGEATGDLFGFQVSGAGDVNGDGFDDLIVGALGADPNGSNSGASYVIFGRPDAFGPTLNLATLDGGTGFKLLGESAYDQSGLGVSGAGDVNGDGFDDLIIGAAGADPGGPYSGASYVVFGGVTMPAVPNLTIDNVNITEGNQGTTAAVFTVSLSRPSSDVITVQYATADGSALAPDDYTALTLTTLTFNPGDVSKTLSVAVRGDSTFEPDETFFVNLSNPTNAAILDAQGQGAIVNDDSNVVFNPGGGGGGATFTDADGDQVVIKVNKGALSAANLVFDGDGNLILIDLTGGLTARGGDGGASFANAKLTVSAQSKSGGDGLINVGAVNAMDISLKSVKIDGDLGKIDAGEGQPGKKAFKKLTANSIGFSATPGAESMIAGSVGVLKIKNNVRGVMNVTGGLADDAGLSASPVQAINKVVIGGDIDGSAGGERAGLLRISGGIGSVKVKGSVMGGADLSGIVVGGKAGKIKIGGDLMSDDADRPVTVSALGTVGVTKQGKAVALKQVQVGGNVLNAEILAGFRRDGTAINGDAGIGKIVVDGDWIASSAAAGVEDVTGDGFGINDALIGGGNAGVISRIASITIAGQVSGTVKSGDHFGITAEQIVELKLGRERQLISAGNGDVISLAEDFTAVDFA